MAKPDIGIGVILADNKHTVAERVAQLRRIISVREWRSVRQNEVAAVAGVKQPTWSGWEDGATPDLRALARIGASSDWVLHEIGDPFIKEIAIPELSKESEKGASQSKRSAAAVKKALAKEAAAKAKKGGRKPRQA
jgi:hypothetical protein